MPQKKINIPSPIRLVDPTTGIEIQSPDGVFSFVEFVRKVNANPLWNETWQASLAQRSIAAALGGATDVLLISEEDWRFLEAAVKHPKTLIISSAGSVVIPGFGMHPSLAGQVVTFQLAVINAETV